MSEYLLEVNNLKMHFPIHGGILWRRIGKVYAADGVSLTVRAGETLGLVGESGCGKTTVGRSIARLYKPTEGKIIFSGKDMSHISRKELRELRRDLQIIFQDPFESLDSRQTVGDILEEPFIIHRIGTPEIRKVEVKKLLARVGLDENAINRFPHEFSGGQRQRIGIARAIALKPKMIICDEPVSALDVSIQAQILNLIDKLNLARPVLLAGGLGPANIELAIRSTQSYCFDVNSGVEVSPGVKDHEKIEQLMSIVKGIAAA